MNQLNEKEKTAFNQIFGNVSEFAQGQQDCRAGLPTKGNASKEYLSGYGFEYERGDIKTGRLT